VSFLNDISAKVEPTSFCCIAAPILSASAQFISKSSVDNPAMLHFEEENDYDIQANPRNPRL